MHKKLLLLVVVFSGVLFGCSKKWDDHDAITDSSLQDNLMEAISKTPNLTKFTQLLEKSGYDKVLSSSKTFTVWAPSDAALQSLDASVINDSVKLKQFVGNHISYESYLAGSSPDQRVKMLNGKYIAVSGNSFDSAQIETANRYANNGVFHVINKFVPRTDNIWEFLKNGTQVPAMRNFLLSLSRDAFDPSKATQTGIDPLTGQPVYDTASGLVQHNDFLDSVMNVSNESDLYTLFVLQDDAFNTELNKLTPWFKTSTADSTKKLGGFWLVKDMVFKGLYLPSQLPDTLVSQYGVKVPINKSAIIASYKTSNGIVYVMNEMNFKLTDKFPPIYIQGENPLGFTTSDRNSNTFYRVRVNPVTGQHFQDIYMMNYNYGSYYIKYLAQHLNSMRYNAYWVAVNDVQTTPLWDQRLAIDSANNASTLPYVQVGYKNYDEVPLGQFTVNNYRNVPLFVVGPSKASNSGGYNSISLDYIKLEPAF